MKVYVVTSGSYSDYQIEKIFSARETAEMYIDAFGDDDDWDVEEYEVEDELDSEKVKKQALYSVSINIKSGEVYVSGRYTDSDGWSYQSQKDGDFWYDGNGKIRMYLHGDGRERVRKVAAERWMQIKAMEQITFPYIFQKVVVTYKHFGLPLHEYPKYNFFTKDIMLEKDSKLDIPGRDNEDIPEGFDLML